MPNYKVVVHKDKFGTKPVYTNRQVSSKRLAEKIYALTVEYPGCHITMSPEITYIITKNQSISKQLKKLTKAQN